MAATGKKGKKAKWIAASITDIIAQPTANPAPKDWAEPEEELEGSYGYSSHTRAPVVLPSASRAARGGLAVDDESIPRRPPYVAYISNLPYDVDESTIMVLFVGLPIVNLRLPREADRLKGYGYVEFEDRESLINAMNIADLNISGRRMRIDVSTNENDRRMGNRGRSDRERDYDPERTMGDWRSGPRSVPQTQSRGRTMDRERDRDGEPNADSREGGWRGGDRPMPEPARSSFGGARDRDSSADNKPGGWRDGDRPAAEPARTPYGGRDSYGRDRERDRDDRYGDNRERGERGFGRDNFREGGERGYGGRDGFRTADRGYSREGGRGFGERRGFGDRDRDPPERNEPSKPRERPKLNLLPRTVPREDEGSEKPAARPVSAESVFGAAKPVDTAAKEREIEERLRKQAEEPSASKPVSAEKVFGGAKPVDTAAKEREIEERLRKQQEEEARRGGEDRERWGRKTDHSGDRRGGGRKDDQRGGSRDSKGYNRDRRDYSKDDRDRRDYSKEDRERRDYNRNDKDRRDTSRDSGDRREGSRDNGDKRDGSRDSRDRRDNQPKQHSRDGSRDRDGNHDDFRDRRDSDTERDKDRDRDDTERKEQYDTRNGKEERQSRARDREDREDKPLPKLKEQEPPNFIASNKFSFLEEADDAVSE